jgi:hypothetical protein
MNRSTKWCPTLGCATIGVLLPIVALAQGDTLRQELAKCSRIAEVTTRVACYDALARPQQDEPRVETATATAPPLASRPAPLEAKAPREPTQRSGEELTAKVTALKEIQRDKLQITLENGQVWQQTVGKPFLLRANDTVRIAATGWGRSFRLEVVGHSGYIQVSRLQ